MSDWGGGREREIENTDGGKCTQEKRRVLEHCITESKSRTIL